MMLYGRRFASLLRELKTAPGLGSVGNASAADQATTPHPQNAEKSSLMRLSAGRRQLAQNDGWNDRASLNRGFQPPCKIRCRFTCLCVKEPKPYPFRSIGKSVYHVREPRRS